MGEKKELVDELKKLYEQTNKMQKSHQSLFNLSLISFLGTLVEKMGWSDDEERIIGILENKGKTDERIFSIVETQTERIEVLKEQITTITSILKKAIDAQNKIVSLVEKHNEIFKDITEQKAIQDINDMMKLSIEELNKIIMEG